MTDIHRRTEAGVAQAVIDRLVDGELDETARAAALRALDAEPGGWRRCATAFLEAQAWRQAAESAGPAAAAPPVATRSQGSARRAFVRQFIGIAAAIAVAFCAGFAARSVEPSRQVVTGNAGAAGGAGTGSRVLADAGGAPGAPDAGAVVEAAPAVPEYLRRRMEREGYEVSGGRRLVPVALEDGRKVAVPVETVSYRYVGRRFH